MKLINKNDLMDRINEYLQPKTDYEYQMRDDIIEIIDNMPVKYMDDTQKDSLFKQLSYREYQDLMLSNTKEEDSHRPLGRFFYIDDRIDIGKDVFVGINNDSGSPRIKEFLSFEEMTKWFNGDKTALSLDERQVLDIALDASGYSYSFENGAHILHDRDEENAFPFYDTASFMNFLNVAIKDLWWNSLDQHMSLDEVYLKDTPLEKLFLHVNNHMKEVLWENPAPDICHKPTIFYMNGNDSTGFDSTINNRFCEFMVFKDDGEVYAATYVDMNGEIETYILDSTRGRTNQTYHGKVPQEIDLFMALANIVQAEEDFEIGEHSKDWNLSLEGTLFKVKEVFAKHNANLYEKIGEQLPRIERQHTAERIADDLRDNRELAQDFNDYADMISGGKE